MLLAAKKHLSSHKICLKHLHSAIKMTINAYTCIFTKKRHCTPVSMIVTVVELQHKHFVRKFPELHVQKYIQVSFWMSQLILY